MLDLALSRQPAKRRWDQGTFAQEVGLRHGAKAADAIDKLFRSANTSAAEIAEFLKGLEELQKLDRPDGRNDSELWPEELNRKNALSA